MIRVLDDCEWRNALETVINSGKPSDALGNPYAIHHRQEQHYALLKKIKEKKHILYKTHTQIRRLT